MVTTHKIMFQSAGDMEFLASESVDLVVTSPPYPMIEMWDEIFSSQDSRIAEALTAADGREAFELMHRLLDPVWKECHRIIKPGGFVCINIGDATRTIGGTFRLYTNHARIIRSCESAGFQSLPAVLWRKQTNAPNKFMGSGMLPSGAYVTLEHEYILIFRKGGKREFSTEEKERRRHSAFFWEERNIWFSDLWDFKGTGQQLGAGDTRKRSGAFPFELAFRLLNMYSMQGDMVVDPFVGTGTTIIAAMAAGRNSLGIEIDTAFLPIIDAVIGKNIHFCIQRQKLRLLDHMDFLSEYQRERKKEFPYYNKIHNIPVMTRQEVNLTIPIIKTIQKPAQGEYHIDYAPAGIEKTGYLPF